MRPVEALTNSGKLRSTSRASIETLGWPWRWRVDCSPSLWGIMKQICFALVLSLTACSFCMTRGPSDTGKPPRAYPSCTSSMTYPVVDGVLGGLFLLSMAAALSEDDQSSTSFDDDEASTAEKVTSTAILAGIFGISAYVGYSRVSRCRGAHEDFRAAYPNGMQPYGGYPYQPYGYQQPQYPPP